ncbi:Pls/PosA family non-ribosomal peptide synthetase [Brevibacterium spongiae]|uniref:AMP-binding protein n=1 Tax=Brevibacterium spongiae TaxID=2909672 RepID=A0ABY5SSJ4_9MICO|nr:Pls/PosA family non-ribosomal peptide synthetase [Brevibacterium spongiae]UVI36851.1 AMP-binding protein [Brevibacterium spongiae]
MAIFDPGTAPAPRTLLDIFDRTVDAHPETTAIDAAERQLSYRDLAAEAAHLAARLHRLGIGPGTRVGIRVPSGTADLYLAILGVLHAGAAYVPVDWDDSEERAATVFAEADVAAVIGERLGIVPTGERRGPLSPEDVRAPSLDDDAWIIFTSGSTGKPKGVAITHRSAAALVDAEHSLYLAHDPLGPADRVMAGLSVAFDASCEEMWLAWRNGAVLVPAPRDIVRSGPDLGDWLRAQRITAVSTVPTLASLWPAEALAHVRLLIFGGEACPAELISRLHQPWREVWNSYGPTEATVIVSAAMLVPGDVVRIGRPIDGWELAVVDPDTEHPVGWGQSGELVVGGVGLGRYLDAVKDAEKYAPLPALGWDRAYRTGDLVRADRAGLLFEGRIDDQVKLGGKRLELGEVDTYLAAIAGVNAGAAAVQKTAGGSDVLVGYLTETQPGSIDLEAARQELTQKLSAGVVPVLTVLGALPMKSSGKVDRTALPWPLTPAEADSDDALTAEQRWLKDLWIEQLGPLGIDADTNFFSVGGGSVQVARLVATIRRSHPSASIAQLYAHPTLAEMSDYIGTLSSSATRNPMPGRLPLGPRLFQLGFIAGIYALNAVRYVIATVTVVWALDFFLEAAWVPHVPFAPVALAWVLVFSPAGRIAQAVIVARTLTFGLRPGEYRRGGWTHVRLWAADRFFVFLRLEHLAGTRLNVLVHRLLGNSVGDGAYLANQAPTSGMARVGDHAVVERDVDLRGYRVEGDVVVVGQIRIGGSARIGTRAALQPGTTVGCRSEVHAGSLVDIDVHPDEAWGGSPLQYLGAAGQTWPEQQLLETRVEHRWSRITTLLAESAGLSLIGLLPLLAFVPGIIIVLPQVIRIDHFPTVAGILVAWVPLTAVLTVLTWLSLIVITVRALAYRVQPGFYRQDSATGWAVWLTQVLLDRTLVSAYPIYASVLTPVFLRCLGARVGKGTEISTLETIPHLTWIQDRAFIADHALLNAPRHYRGWIHIGTTVVGRGTFVGNSAIVGADIDLPPDSLVAVLGSSPVKAPVGSSWIGGTAQAIPRSRSDAGAERTYRPGRSVMWARTAVECGRIIPFILTNWIELGLVVALNAVYMSTLFATDSVLRGLLMAVLAAFPLTLAAGIVSVLIAVAAKWALVGRFAEKERPLFSSFVWRNELADVFAESLAVASLIKISIGSPLVVWYARLMGAKIGRHVWLETWWLPEFDLITIGARTSINRGTVIQTHLFHDRVMSLVPTRLETGSTLGVNSFVLPGSVIGARTIVGDGSLVLRDEELPSDTRWQGNPVESTAKKNPT